MGRPGPWQQYLEARVYGLGSEIAAAEARGFRRAIEALRDEDRFYAWRDAQPYWEWDTAQEHRAAAEYLEHLATKETRDGR
jgi:hypothetical protein